MVNGVNRSPSSQEDYIEGPKSLEVIYLMLIRRTTIVSSFIEEITRFGFLFDVFVRIVFKFTTDNQREFSLFSHLSWEGRTIVEWVGHSGYSTTGIGSGLPLVMFNGSMTPFERVWRGEMNLWLSSLSSLIRFLSCLVVSNLEGERFSNTFILPWRVLNNWRCLFLIR